MFSNILLNKKNNLLMAFAILITFALGPIRSHSEILSVGKEEIDIIHNIIKASKNNDWLHLTKITKNSNSQHFRDLCNWIYFINNTDKIDLKKLQEFYSKYKKWPGTEKVKIYIEKKIDWFHNKNINENNWLNTHSPISHVGKIKLYEKIINKKNLEETEKEIYLKRIIENWITGTFEISDEKYILEHYSEYLNESSHNNRLDNLIWNRKWSHAKRQLNRVEAQYRKLAIAKIKLARRNYGVDKAVSEVPKIYRNSEGLIYERIRWRRISNLRKPSLDLLKNYLESGYVINHPKKWWIEINWHARKLLENNKPNEAYFLVKNHNQKSIKNISDAEWLSGWIALQFLNDPQKAKTHFLKMQSIVKMPISISRANYWLAKTENMMGNKTKSLEYYKQAAIFNSTYYGLLSKEIISNELADNMNMYANFKGADQYIENPRLNVLRLLSYGNEQSLNRKFIDGLMKDSPSKNFIDNILEILQESRRTDLFLITVKKAVRLNKNYQKYLFPYPLKSGLNFKIAGSKVDFALLLSVAKQESEFYSNAKSNSGAIGVLQVMPKTAKLVSKKLGISYNKVLLTNDLNYNITIASTYLFYLLEQFDDSIVLALASYNAGPTRTLKWIKLYGNPSEDNIDPVDWIEKIPFNETRNYIQRVIENLLVYRKVVEDRAASKNTNIMQILKNGL